MELLMFNNVYNSNVVVVVVVYFNFSFNFIQYILENIYYCLRRNSTDL
jgi:hypothetical protein